MVILNPGIEAWLTH